MFTKVWVYTICEIISSSASNFVRSIMYTFVFSVYEHYFICITFKIGYGCCLWFLFLSDLILSWLLQSSHAALFVWAFSPGPPGNQGPVPVQKLGQVKSDEIFTSPVSYHTATLHPDILVRRFVLFRCGASVWPHPLPFLTCDTCHTRSFAPHHQCSFLRINPLLLPLLLISKHQSWYRK